jgi:hypothetical protein
MSSETSDAATLTPPFPLMDEDWEWFAFDRAWTRRQVVSELVHNLIDWYLDNHTWYDDEDKVHGWFGAYRALFDSLTESWIRPHEPTDETGEKGWWFETHPNHPLAVPAWVVNLG